MKLWLQITTVYKRLRNFISNLPQELHTHISNCLPDTSKREPNKHPKFSTAQQNSYLPLKTWCSEAFPILVTSKPIFRVPQAQHSQSSLILLLLYKLTSKSSDLVWYYLQKYTLNLTVLHDHVYYHHRGPSDLSPLDPSAASTTLLLLFLALLSSRPTRPQAI